MGTKKTNESAVSVDELLEKIKTLQYENEAIRAALNHSDSIALDNERRMSREHKARMHERNESAKTISDLTYEVESLKARLGASKELRAVEKDKRHRSIPKFVFTSLGALALLAIPYALHMAGQIDYRLAFGIEAPLMMVIAWCYALIWDRSRK